MIGVAYWVKVCPSVWSIGLWILDLFRVIWSKRESQFDWIMFSKETAIAWRIYLFFKVAVTWNIIVYLLIPSVIDAMLAIFTSDTRPYFVPVPLSEYLEVEGGQERSPYYYFVTLTSSVWLQVNAATCVGIQSVFCVLVVYTVAEIKMLKYHILQLRINSDRKFDESSPFTIGLIVREHQAIIRLYQEIKDYIGPQLAIQYFISSVSMCIGFYVMSTGRERVASEGVRKRLSMEAERERRVYKLSSDNWKTLTEAITAPPPPQSLATNVKVDISFINTKHKKSEQGSEKDAPFKTDYWDMFTKMFAPVEKTKDDGFRSEISKVQLRMETLERQLASLTREMDARGSMEERERRMLKREKKKKQIEYLNKADNSSKNVDTSTEQREAAKGNVEKVATPSNKTRQEPTHPNTVDEPVGDTVERSLPDVDQAFNGNFKASEKEVKTPNKQVDEIDKQYNIPSGNANETNRPLDKEDSSDDSSSDRKPQAPTDVFLVQHSPTMQSPCQPKQATKIVSENHKKRDKKRVKYKFFPFLKSTNKNFASAYGVSSTDSVVTVRMSSDGGLIVSEEEAELLDSLLRNREISRKEDDKTVALALINGEVTVGPRGDHSARTKLEGLGNKRHPGEVCVAAPSSFSSSEGTTTFSSSSEANLHWRGTDHSRVSTPSPSSESLYNSGTSLFVEPKILAHRNIEALITELRETIVKEVKKTWQRCLLQINYLVERAESAEPSH
ncbi:hypothetical protein AAG570_009553 [Ranatra chinensis]|uniref:Uncharacterized protein n=1 Tax=Ranatra chinensis TaxID=642074 RepID=A0ABD0Z2D9_9HEMI